MRETPAALAEIHPDVEYQAFLNEGRFLIQRDRKSGKAFFYPRVHAPLTGSRDLEWFEPSGRATVHAVTVVSRRPPTPNYNVVLVELEEGPRLMSRVENMEPEDVHIGLQVRARVDQVDGTGILVFDPASIEEAGA